MVSSDSDSGSKIDVSQAIDDLERCLRSCSKNSTAANNALAILKRWQYDESLTQACRERAGQLVREFC